MNLLEVESRPKLPVWIILLTLCGIGFAVTTFVTGEIDFVVGGIPFCTVAFCLFLVRPAQFSAVFSENEVSLQNSQQVIPYDSISYVHFEAKHRKDGQYDSKPAAISVTHDAGEFVIPARLNQPSADVYEFLFERFIPRDIYPLDPVLQDFVDEQEQLFGAEKVYSFTARPHSKKRSSRQRTLAAMAAGLALAALGWGIAAEMLMQDGWFGGAITLGIVAIVFFLISLVQSRPGAGIKNWDLAGVVVSPIGVAMIQGQLKGRMKWEEIRSVQFGNQAKAFEYSNSASPKGIVLQFDGGALAIVDIYNQPLQYIHSVIQGFWQGGEDA